MNRNFDVIVIGIGAMGSSACYYLASQGLEVLGIEQFDIPNELSSHTGQSRIIRKAYFEHPDYVPLLERSYQNWKHLENITGEQIYFETGLLYAGPSGHDIIKGVHDAAGQYKIRLDNMRGDELKAIHPQIDLPEHYEILFEPETGFIMPEKAIKLFSMEAEKKATLIKTRTKVKGWKKTKDGIELKTTSETFYAKKLVITAGPWTGELISQFSPVLNVTRQVLGWMDMKESSRFELNNFPCWMIVDESRQGVFYGFPSLPRNKFAGPEGFKLGLHFPGDTTDPNQVDRQTRSRDEIILVEFLNKYFPGCYKSTNVMKTCMYTNTPDENFIIDFLEGDKDVVVACGFSGHGFKFASAIGEILADLTIKGETNQAIGFLSAGRFRK